MEKQQAQLIPNSIAFNGIITSDEPIDVGGGYYVLNILAGGKDEFPILLIKASLKEITDAFRKDDKIAGIGILSKLQNEWCIKVKELNRIPTDEEFEKLK